MLHGAFARGALRRDPTPRQRKEAEMMVELAELGWGKENPAFRQFFTSLFIPDGTPEQHRWWNRLEQVTTSPANAARFMRVLGDIDVTAIAPRVACPTLVLHAVRDARIPFEEGRLLASLVPGARFVPLESGNHVLLEHEPAWRRWLEEVRAFLPVARGGGGAFAPLTPRQSELVELIAQGLDNAQIAARIGVSEKTVRNHITAIFAKLDVREPLARDRPRARRGVREEDLVNARGAAAPRRAPRDGAFSHQAGQPPHDASRVARDHVDRAAPACGARSRDRRHHHEREQNRHLPPRRQGVGRAR